MKAKLWTKGLALIMTAAMLLVGCGGREASNGAEQSNNEGTGTVETQKGETYDTHKDSLKIGFAASTMDTNDMNWYAGIQEALAEYPNIELSIFDAEGSAEKQTQQFEEMINQGYNAIIVNTLDTAALSAVTTQAENAGIKVVHINIGPDSVHTGGVENASYNIGVTAAKDVMERVEGAKCVAIGPPVSMSAVVLGVVGFKDTLAENSKFEFLEEQAGDWTTENANELTRNLMTKYKNDIGVIFCHNDAMAMGAAQAVDAAGMTGKVLIYGVDGLQEACAYIKEGSMTGSVYCDSKKEGIDAANMALAALESGVIGSSQSETPIVIAETTIIDASNVDEFLK